MNVFSGANIWFLIEGDERIYWGWHSVSRPSQANYWRVATQILRVVFPWTGNLTRGGQKF